MSGSAEKNLKKSNNVRTERPTVDFFSHNFSVTGVKDNNYSYAALFGDLILGKEKSSPRHSRNLDEFIDITIIQMSASYSLPKKKNDSA